VDGPPLRRRAGHGHASRPAVQDPARPGLQPAQ
jgi:hypothetical protein